MYFAWDIFVYELCFVPLAPFGKPLGSLWPSWDTSRIPVGWLLECVGNWTSFSEEKGTFTALAQKNKAPMILSRIPQIPGMVAKVIPNRRSKVCKRHQEGVRNHLKVTSGESRVRFGCSSGPGVPNCPK